MTKLYRFLFLKNKGKTTRTTMALNHPPTQIVNNHPVYIIRYYSQSSKIMLHVRCSNISRVFKNDFMKKKVNEREKRLPLDF